MPHFPKFTMPTLPKHFNHVASFVTDRSYEEARQFKQLQYKFSGQFESVFPDKMAAKTVVIIPSLTLDPEIANKIDGMLYYEERMLCLLLLLRMPRTHVIYLTSMPIDPAIIDYYIHLLPGITGYHARQRLTLLSCFDSSQKSLTEKILERPRLIERIRDSIPHNHIAHLSCFNVTDLERSLAVKLQLPIYGCDPDLLYLSTKSTGRKIFRKSGINVPPGFEDLVNMGDIIKALTALKQRNPHLLKAVVKMNDGFSGEGNAVFSYRGAPENDTLKQWIGEHLIANLQIVATNLNFEAFIKKFEQMGGMVEAFIEGFPKESPSVQCRINPLGKIDIISTHDQLLGGENGQIFLGATFPALNEYAGEIGRMGRKIAEELRKYGVLGRFGIDFISVKEKDEWKHYAIELNLRKGGTTHPYIMLQFLTDGEYDEENGVYYTAGKQPRYYLCSDNLQSEYYKGLTPHDLIDIAMCNNLLYDGSTQEGVIFHLISTLSQYGKLGVLCIGSTPKLAEDFYRKTVEVLNKEGRA
jgi:hypothetical protein